jgi:sugar phosphate permease
MNQSYTSAELREIAKAQKLLIWSVAAGILSFFVIATRMGILISLAISIFQIFALYKLGTALKLSVVWLVLFAVGMFIPLLNLLLLLSTNEKANKALKVAGVKVGFMGANPDDIRG